MGIALFLDVIIAALLVATISYAVVLNRKLQALRQDRSEMEALARAFTEATNKAEASITKLKKTTEELAGPLKSNVDKAEALRDDLTFLVDRASSLADRLEEGVRTARSKDGGAVGASSSAHKGGRKKGAKDTAPAQETKFEDDDESAATSDAEQELLKALQSVR